MQELDLYQVDAFTDRPFAGNPAAVVPLVSWLDTAVMQAIALENNLSETVFFIPLRDDPDYDFHIRWSTLKPEAIEPDITKALADAQTAVDAVAALSETDTELSYENTLVALDKGLEVLNRAWGLVSHLDSVCNSPELREAHNKMLPAVSEFFSGIPLNEKLWKTLKHFGENPATLKLSPTKQRYVHETMADFREQGADLPPEQKQRAAEIQKRLAELTQKYSENCLDATNAWEQLITDEADLSGLPESAIAAARQSAEQKEKAGWRFTLQAPSYIPVMTYADNDALREAVWSRYRELQAWRIWL